MKKVPVVVFILFFVSQFLVVNIPIETNSVIINQELPYNNWSVHSSQTPIGTEYFIMWSFYQSNPFVIIEVFALDQANYTNFYQETGKVVKFQLSYDQLSDQGCFYPEYESVWHVIFHNVDVQFQRHTIISMEVEFEEQDPEQNDARSGTDAGSTLEDAILLQGENLNSSGMLVYNDIKDIYKFRASANDLIYFKLGGLYDSNVNFSIISPSGLEVFEHKGMIRVNLTYQFTMPSTGYWLLVFEKSDPTNLYKEVYDFKLIWRNYVETGKIGNFTLFTSILVLVPVVLLKRRDK